MSTATNGTTGNHSTGPRTDEGKARSSQNARTHGFTAQHLFLAPHQREEFEALRSQYQSDIHPDGAVQQTLFDELVASAWNLRRIIRMEAELNATTQSDLELLNDTALQTKLDRLARHHTRIERTFHRSLRELKALQTNTAIMLTLPKFFTEFVPPLASAIQIAKRTQMITSTNDLNPVQDEHDALKAASRRHRHAADPVKHPPSTVTH